MAVTKKVDHRYKANGHLYRKAKAKFIEAADPWCTICGEEVDKTLLYPDPASAVVDHILALANGGSARALSNWALAHSRCNIQKGSKLDYVATGAYMANTEQVATARATSTNGCPFIHITSRSREDVVDCPNGFQGFHWRTPKPSRDW